MSSEREDPPYRKRAREPHLITPKELNNLRDLHLPKQQADLLASRLQAWNLL